MSFGQGKLECHGLLQILVVIELSRGKGSLGNDLECRTDFRDSNEELGRVDGSASETERAENRVSNEADRLKSSASRASRQESQRGLVSIAL